MRIVPAARRLADFGSRSPAPPAKAPAPPAQPDAGEMLARAREEGRRQGLREAEAAHEARLKELAARHEEALAACRRECAARTAASLTEDLRQGLAKAQERISEAVAEILAPLLEASARERALAELADLLKEMFAADGALRVRVTGPEALLEELRGRLGGQADRVGLHPDESAAEISVEADDAYVETRLGEWMSGLAAGEDS